MPLGPGSRLDAYELLQPLGAGGMGEVWLATEVRLGRKVALKLLPAELTRDPARVSRFEQEARAASGLSHPNVCTIHALGETAEGQHYIAMEYVEGETLRRRIAGGRLTIRESLDIAIQIASALVAAHSNGIVHRDIKPENVILRPDGFVKVLDFGLAKLTAATDSAAVEATHTAFRTDAGTVVGTVTYMSPEQARGQQVDARTDIWALGCVLYEMVAGRSPFAAQSSSDVLAAILDREPAPLTRFEPGVAPELQRIVAKSLKKSLDERYQTSRDLQTDLKAHRDSTPSGSAPADQRVTGEHLRSEVGGLQDIIPGSVESSPLPDRPLPARADVPARSRVFRTWLSIAGAAVLVGLAIGAKWLVGRSDEPVYPGERQVGLSRNLVRLTFDDLSGFATFSPDGRFVAYASTRSGGGDLDIWVQASAGGNPVRITKSPADESEADWSPDGTSIAFTRDGDGIFAVPPLGGQELRVSTFGRAPLWSPDGRQILFATKPLSSALSLFLAALGGPPGQILGPFLAGGEWRRPAWHPDGRITIAGRHRTEGLGIFTVSAHDGRWVRTIVPQALLAASKIDPGRIDVLAWAPDARFLYAACLSTEGVLNIWRLQVDTELRIAAMDRLTTGPGADWWPRLSRDGKRLLFSVITGDSRLWEFPVGPTPIESAGAGRPVSEEDGQVNWASLSPDGRRLAYYYQPLHAAPQHSELRIASLPFTEPPTRVPADRYVRMASAWSHSGGRLALQAAERSATGAAMGNLLVIRDHDGSERVIGRCQAPSCSLVPVDWTPDDSAILVTSRLSGERRTSLSLWSVQTAAEKPTAVLVSDPDWNASQGAFSPDGRWLAFAYGGDFRDESGIAVVPAAGTLGRAGWRPIAEGYEYRGNPRWSPDGRFLYFSASYQSHHLNVWRVGVSASAPFSASAPTAVTAFRGAGFFLLNRSYYPRIAVGADRLILPMNSQKMATWMLDNVDK